MEPKVDFGRRVPFGPGGQFLGIGRDGWVFVYLGERAPDVRVMVMPEGSPGKSRLVIHALWVRASAGPQSPASLAPTDIRDLVLGKIESMLNTPGYAGAVLGSLRRSSGPDFSPVTDWKTAFRKAADLAVVGEEEGSLRIEVPAERVHSDEFYLTVARTFARALQRSKRPAVDIANASGVPRTTVHRWLKEARRRGVLAPARRGRVDNTSQPTEEALQ